MKTEKGIKGEKADKGKSQPKQPVKSEHINLSLAGEKKSWEYVYNYDGMDQKMIEQRKRRIALKKMFEDMQL